MALIERVDVKETYDLGVSFLPVRLHRLVSRSRQPGDNSRNQKQFQKKPSLLLRLRGAANVSNRESNDSHFISQDAS